MRPEQVKGQVFLNQREQQHKGEKTEKVGESEFEWEKSKIMNRGEHERDNIGTQGGGGKENKRAIKENKSGKQ